MNTQTTHPAPAPVTPRKPDARAWGDIEPDDIEPDDIHHCESFAFDEH